MQHLPPMLPVSNLNNFCVNIHVNIFSLLKFFSFPVFSLILCFSPLPVTYSPLLEFHAPSCSWQGKSLFMPLRVLLTGKLHGPDIASSVLLLRSAGSSDVLAPETKFVTLEERFKLLSEVEWESFKNIEPVLESAAAAAVH